MENISNLQDSNGLQQQQQPQQQSQQQNRRPGKLLVISNRLPISISRDAETGKWKSGGMSSGGLVAALSGIPRDSFIWIGWTGANVPKEEEDQVTKLLEDEGCAPVFLSSKLADQHYNGFSNGILWPLFHYQTEDVEFNDELYGAYTTANQAFADAVESLYKPGDLIWIHDMHLMLVPRMLRKQLHKHTSVEKLKIGFFLHIPFPTSEVFHVLPWKKELLKGVLESDLIGFHTYDYAAHFQRTCTHVLGLETKPQGVVVQDRVVAVGVFPIGIEPHKFEEKLQQQSVLDRIKELKDTIYPGKQLIIGVDRLDYIKGIPHRLLGFETYLREHPEARGKVVLLQVAVPSRTDVPEYKKLKSTIDKLVGRINSTYGNLLENYSPVQYLFRSVDFAELTAMYTRADCCFITSLRDGMNLVALEYIICQGHRMKDPDGPGVLILSEFAGASGSLIGGALSVNPWNAEQLSESLRIALTMSSDSRRAKHDLLYKYAKKYTARYWGDSYINELKKQNPLQPASTPSSPMLRVAQKYGSRPGSRPSSRPSSRPGSPTGLRNSHNIASALNQHLASAFGVQLITTTQEPPTHRQIINAFQSCKRRYLILEYDGVLVPFVSLPSLSRPPRKLATVLRSLAALPGTLVFVMSGRDRKTLDQWFPPNFNIGLSAEQGCFLRFPSTYNNIISSSSSSSSDLLPPDVSPPTKSKEGWEQIIPDLDLSWKHAVRPLMEHYSARTPGSFIEETDFQLIWHYRNSEDPFGTLNARELHHLVDNIAVSVEVKDKRLAIKPLHSNQSVALRQVLHNAKANDFVMVIGDFSTHIDFVELPEKSYAFGIGKSREEGKWMMKDSEEVNDLLDDLLNVKL